MMGHQLGLSLDYHGELLRQDLGDVLMVVLASALQGATDRPRLE